MKLLLPLSRRFVQIFLFLLVVDAASAQHFDWALQIGGLGLDVGRSVCADNQGNVLLVGSFSESAQVADTFLIGQGSSEAFVGKFTAQGELLWARMISGPKEDMARAVTTDDEGNVYVVGHFTDSVVFVLNETDTVAAASNGGKDVFVAKYDANGTFQWFISGGGLGNDSGTGIDWSEDGKLYVSGEFEKRATFGSASLLSYGMSDGFLIKIDPLGNVHWARRFGGLEHDVASGLSVDHLTGSVFVTGDFYDQAEFSGTMLNAMGSSDMFLLRYSKEGVLQWAVQNGGTSVDVATDIGSDLNGNVFVTGYYQGTTVFQNHQATALSYNDVFLSRFDTLGNCQWLSSAGSYGLDNCLGMDVAWDGTTYLTGMFEDLIVAGNDSTYGNGYDIFVLSYSPSGQIIFGRSAGAASADFGMATCLSPDGSLYITGYYYFYADFDQFTLDAADHGDIFLAKLSDIVSVEHPWVDDGRQCLWLDASSGTLNLTCDDAVDWHLTNVQGQMIAYGKVYGKTVHLPLLSKGVYIVSVRFDIGTVSRKIVLK